MTRETKIILLSTLAMGTIVGLVMIRQRNRKELDEIIDKINTGQGATGTVDDLKYSKAFNPEYYKTRPASELYTVKYAQSQAKIIHEADKYFNDDEDAVYGVFNRAKSLAALSQISEQFGKIYGTPMFKYMRAFLDDNELAVVQARIMQMK